MSDRTPQEIISSMASIVRGNNRRVDKIKKEYDKLNSELTALKSALSRANLGPQGAEKLKEGNDKVQAFRDKLLGLVDELELIDVVANTSTDIPEAFGNREIMDDRNSSEEGSTFSDFLSNIGASVVESQQKLDDQSLAYLASTRDRKYIPPTLFRIPKISAELKVALSDEKSKGLNVLLFSEKRKMNRLNQQSLKFDIVAVPPSPDMLKAAYEEIPRIDFVFERVERKKVFSILHDEELLNTIENARIKKQIVEISEAARQNQVVIWRIGENEKYLLLYPDPDGDEDSGLGIWHLDGKNKTIDTVMRGDLKPKPGETKRPLWAFITKLASDQQVLIG